MAKLHPNASQVAGLGSFAAILPYDGAVVFQARTYEDITAIFQSQEYQEKVVPDEEKFVDRTNFAMFPCDMVTVHSKED